MPNSTRSFCFLAAALHGLAVASIPAQAAEPCTEINIQTIAENRLKDGLIGERQVGIFFAGTNINTLPDNEKKAIEAELDRFFHAFRAVFVEHEYHWKATPEAVERAQAQFDYLVVFDAELNAGALPKYNANLNMYAGKLIDPTLIGFVDYIRASDMNTSVPAAFAQVDDKGPVGSSVMFAEFILLVLGAHLSVHAGGDYYEQLSNYVSQDLKDVGAIKALQDQHEMLVYGCLAPVFG